jgi:hypothetical protein
MKFKIHFSIAVLTYTVICNNCLMQLCKNNIKLKQCLTFTLNPLYLDVWTPVWSHSQGSWVLLHYCIKHTITVIKPIIFLSRYSCSQDTKNFLSFGENILIYLKFSSSGDFYSKSHYVIFETYVILCLSLLNVCRCRHHNRSKHQEQLTQWQSITSPKTWIVSNTAIRWCWWRSMFSGTCHYMDLCIVAGVSEELAASFFRAVQEEATNQKMQEACSSTSR